MSKQKAPGSPQAANLQETGASKPTLALMHQSNPRYLLDKTKDELYLITKDFNGDDCNDQIVRTIRDDLFMDNISENLDDLGTLSYALLQAMQLKDVPKAVMTTIRAIARAINGVQDQLRENDIMMEIPIETPWSMLQMHMTAIKEKLSTLTNIIELQDKNIKTIQSH